MRLITTLKLRTFLNKYLKPGKISYQKYVEKKILEPKINDRQIEGYSQLGTIR